MKSSGASASRVGDRIEACVMAGIVLAVASLAGLVAFVGWSMSASGSVDAVEALRNLNDEIVIATMGR